MRIVQLLLSAVVVVAQPTVAAVMSVEQAAKLYGARPDAFSADLSPSGSKLAYLTALDGSRTGVRVTDLATGKVRNIIASTGRPEGLDWCQFATDRWIICRYSGNLPFQGMMVGFSRLIAIDLDNNKMKKLSAPDDPEAPGVKQDDGSVIDWLVDEAEPTVLMARRYRGERPKLGVDRVELNSNRWKSLELPREDASFFMTDGHGQVRLSAEDETGPDGNLLGKQKFRYRLTAGKSWHDLGTYDSKTDSGPYPVVIDGPANSLYFLRKLDGRDALYRMKLDGSGETTLVAKNDLVDIAGVVQIAPGQPVIGYRYVDDRERTEYTDPTYRALGQKLSRAVPNLPLVQFAGASRDASKLLIHAGSDTDPGAYYLLDRKTMRMDLVMEDRPGIDSSKLAPVKSITIPTSDGKTIPAYLTMNVEGPASGRPAIVMPHGGPSARDAWGFDWLAQFLAARGYAVIQPNYRGSSGYGADFLGENAFRDWKTAMRDISSSADYLVKQGIADPKRLAIVGWSYGGYAALQSAVIEPDRYRAVVAIAPVTDLSALRRDAEGFTNEDLAKDFIGKGKNLAEGSPLHHASAIKAPVLLVHGDLDANVRIAHSQRMNAVLRKEGKPVELLTYKNLEHQLDDGNARVDMLTHIGALLERTIGH